MEVIAYSVELQQYRRLVFVCRSEPDPGAAFAGPLDLTAGGSGDWLQDDSLKDEPPQLFGLVTEYIYPLRAPVHRCCLQSFSAVSLVA
jgi:hypothetical protein